MSSFVRERGAPLAGIVLVMVGIAALQAGISYSIALGALHSLAPALAAVVAVGSYALRLAFLMLLSGLWLLNARRMFLRAAIVANAWFTFMLMLSTVSLVRVLSGLTARSAETLLGDAVLMSLSNILIFSIWYWIVDPPGVIDEVDDQPWALLFPQRASPIQGYETWVPRYADYLFVAFTTSFAFSPTDTLPLTRGAKVLMLLQALISVLILTGLAGSAINVLAGSG